MMWSKTRVEAGYVEPKAHYQYILFKMACQAKLLTYSFRCSRVDFIHQHLVFESEAREEVTLLFCFRKPGVENTRTGNQKPRKDGGNCHE